MKLTLDKLEAWKNDASAIKSGGGFDLLATENSLHVLATRIQLLIKFIENKKLLPK